MSIVIVNSDGTSDTLNCIASIYQHPPRDSFEIILVDNCSREPCLSLVAERFPQVRTYSSPTRQGFAKNYNLGIRQARGQFVMILNNDTIVHADALDILVKTAKAHPEYGIIGPRLLSPDGTIQTVCARALISPARYVLNLLIFDLGLPTGKLAEAWRQRELSKRSSGAVPCLSGACMLLARATLDQIGLLDEGFDFYFEDVEWCHRAQKLGWQVFYVADAKITHLGDRSLGKVKEWAKKSEYQSALRYFRRYYPWSLWRERALWLIVAINFFLRMLAFSAIEIVGKRSGNARAYWNLLKWIACEFPRANRITV
ncbi:MAG: glycosyltransferase family 2 protein [Anaerolineae bacterium]|nr:glycosyltransferase family 2 protein [Anaerolineae bacterium]